MNLALGIWLGGAAIYFAVKAADGKGFKDAAEVVGLVVVALLWPLWVAGAIVLWSLS